MLLAHVLNDKREERELPGCLSYSVSRFERYGDRSWAVEDGDTACDLLEGDDAGEGKRPLR